MMKRAMTCKIASEGDEMLSHNHKKLKKAFLTLSVVLGISFLIGSGLVWNQLDSLLNSDPVTTTTENELEQQPPPLPPEIQVIIEEIEADDYILHRNATEYQIELFASLIHARNLFYESESEEALLEYATAIAQNFIADFFTLSNKRSRADVGGLQFISSDLRDDFRRFATDTFYLYLNQHLEIYGRDSLPTVESMVVLGADFERRIFAIEPDEEVEEDEIVYCDLNEILGRGLETIIVDVEWTYALSSLEYLDEFQTHARIVLVKTEEGLRIHVIEFLEAATEDEHFNQW